jgi:hypothetical protein
MICLILGRDWQEGGIISESVCTFGCNFDENLSHLLFSCPHTNMIWQKFLMPVQACQRSLSMQEIISTLGAVSPLHRKEWATIFIAIAWNIWLARNHKVFDNANTSSRRLEDRCWNSLDLWAHRSKQLDHREDIQNWTAPGNRIV